MAFVRQSGRVSLCFLMLCVFECLQTGTAGREKIFNVWKTRDDANTHCESEVHGRLFRFDELPESTAQYLDNKVGYWLFDTYTRWWRDGTAGREKIFNVWKTRDDANTHCESEVHGRLFRFDELPESTAQYLDNKVGYWLFDTYTRWWRDELCFMVYKMGNQLEYFYTYCTEFYFFICYYDEEPNIADSTPATETTAIATSSFEAVTASSPFSKLQTRSTLATQATTTATSSFTAVTASSPFSELQTGFTFHKVGTTEALMGTDSNTKGIYIGAGIGLVVIIILIVIVLVVTKRSQRCCFQRKPENDPAVYAEPEYNSSTANGTTHFSNQNGVSGNSRNGVSGNILSSKMIYDKSNNEVSFASLTKCDGPSHLNASSGRETHYHQLHQDEGHYNHTGELRSAALYDPTYSHLGKNMIDDNTDDGDYDTTGEPTRTIPLDPCYSHIGQRVLGDADCDDYYNTTGDPTDKVVLQDQTYSHLGQSVG